MCGIAGELRFDECMSRHSVIKAMCDAQIHRGPDDEGYYVNGPVGVGIRRLAIIDLTKGLYPLRNEEGTIHLVFNGEIYDFGALRTELESYGHDFRSKTDAETVVHSYEQWGTGCISRLRGMYAFALWDEAKKELWIARDHFGIKPLYYYQNDSFFVFASEIKPLLAHPDVPVHPNGTVIREFLWSGLVDDTEQTFFEGINRLAPAHHLLIQPNGLWKRERYWMPNFSRDVDGKISGDEIERTRRLFLEAVRRQLVSDVPVGTCLSGGIDSSSVVCAVKRVHPSGTVSTGQRIKTFSAIFPGDVVDESAFARDVCKATEAEHNPVTPTAMDLWRDLPTVVKCQEEPFPSTSIYAQWRVMKRARELGITVMLDGQGGDELLGGYIPRYYVSYLLTLRKHGRYSRLLKEGLLSFDLTRSFVGASIGRLVARMVAFGKHVITRRRTVGPEYSILGDPPLGRTIQPLDDLPTMMEMDTGVTILPSLLRYEDKNSMWHSVEARVPFLDIQFFEYVASLPLDKKLHNGWTKHIFRLAMKNILPESIRLRRTKIGFQTPENAWLNDLREELRELFYQSNLVGTDYYNIEVLRRLLSKTKLTNQETSLIWRITSLELWYREFIKPSLTREAG
jgi:asparagine synthase (glutamine-hydrolysing)